MIMTSPPSPPPHTISIHSTYLIHFIEKASPPGIPVVEKVGKNSVDLAWSKPRNDGGAPLKGYQIQKKRKGGDWEKVNDYPITGEKATIDDLVEGKSLYEAYILLLSWAK